MLLVETYVIVSWVETVGGQAKMDGVKLEILQPNCMRRTFNARHVQKISIPKRDGHTYIHTYRRRMRCEAGLVASH